MSMSRGGGVGVFVCFENAWDMFEVWGGRYRGGGYRGRSQIEHIQSSDLLATI